MALIEVEFKGRRKGVYYNDQEFPLQLDDLVVVAADRGEDLGKVTLLGTQWSERLCEGKEVEEFEVVLRKASIDDLEIEENNRKEEKEARAIFLDFVKKNELEMKLVDAEYQLDRKKLTFYFTADGRVDFRSLVKDLAHHFKTRIDLRQIGARDESKRLGGMGVCGRDLCCSSWIREFLPVTTAMVKDQYLLLNPQKNTGLCGRLRCCLRYEVDQYRNVNCLFPKLETKVKGPRGEGVLDKIDMSRCCCSVTWENSIASTYTAEQLREISNWDPESEEKAGELVFSFDPTVKEEKEPVQAAPQPTIGELLMNQEQNNADSSDRKDRKDRRQSGKGRRFQKNQKDRTQKTGGSAKNAGSGREKIEIVRAVRLSQDDDYYQADPQKKQGAKRPPEKKQDSQGGSETANQSQSHDQNGEKQSQKKRRFHRGRKPSAGSKPNSSSPDRSSGENKSGSGQNRSRRRRDKR